MRPTLLGMSGGVLFVGSKAMAVSQLRALAESGAPVDAVALLDDSDDERSVLPELRGLAERLDVPTVLVRDAGDLAALVQEHRPALGLVCGWYRILPAGLLDSLPLGWLGVHASALPAYRGFAPVVWAMINGDPVVGVSLFQITPGLDEGDLYGQRSVPVGPDDDVGVVLARIAATSADMVRERVPAVLAGTARAVPQPRDGASYCAARRPEDGELHWGLTARELHDRVRAQAHPYPGAFSWLGDRRVTVWRARVSGITAWGEPGSVVRISPEGVDVACGGGTALTLVDVQVDGESAQPAAAAVRSVRARFGRG